MRRSYSIIAGLGLIAFTGCTSTPTMTGTDMGITMAGADMAKPLPPGLYTNKDNADKAATRMPADYSCLGTFADKPPANNTITVNGRLKDFQDSQPVEGADIRYYATADDAIADKPLTTLKQQQMAMLPPPLALGTAADGTYSITYTLPAGTTRIIIGNRDGKAISGSGAKSDTIPTYEFYRLFDEAAPTAVKLSTKQAIPGLVAVVQKDGYGVLAGAIRDCVNTSTGGAVVSVTGDPNPASMPADTFDGKNYDSDIQNLMFYFTDIGGSTLPNRVQKYSSANGAFAALNVPPGKGSVVVRGVVGSGELKILSTATIPVIADAVTIVDLPPAGK